LPVFNLVSVLRFWPEESIVVFRAGDGAGSVQYPGFGKTDLNKKNRVRSLQMVRLLRMADLLKVKIETHEPGFADKAGGIHCCLPRRGRRGERSDQAG
jgi:hypothetical protein